jgi:DNA-binding ferritin-like protein
MNIKIIAVAYLFFLLSCNDSEKKKIDQVNTNTNNDQSSGDIESQKAALNKQSKACIALMNSLEEEKNTAQGSGDAVTASALQTRIDSAAKENVKIGQKLMALEK